MDKTIYLSASKETTTTKPVSTSPTDPKQNRHSVTIEVKGTPSNTTDLQQIEPDEGTSDSHQSQDGSTLETNETSIKCFVCGARINVKSEYESHMKELHPHSEKPKNCRKCYITFPNLKAFLAHKCVKISSFVCGNCNRSFSIKHELMKHMKTHRKKSEFSCHKCSYKCIAKTYFLLHMKSHGDMPLTCGDCGSECIDKDDLEKHVCKKPATKKFCCEVCGKTWNSKSRLLHHQTSHLKERNFKCDVCDKKFKSEFRLSVHKYIHSGEKRYVCEHCSKKFATSNQLKMHLKNHTGETPYKCTLCGKAYPWRKSLKQHMKKHEVV